MVDVYPIQKYQIPYGLQKIIIKSEEGQAILHFRGVFLSFTWFGALVVGDDIEQDQ